MRGCFGWARGSLGAVRPAIADMGASGGVSGRARGSLGAIRPAIADMGVSGGVSGRAREHPVPGIPARSAIRGRPEHVRKHLAA